MTAPVSRRIVFQGLGALGVAVALAGCGGSDEPGAADPGADGPSTSGGGTAGSPSGGGQAGDQGGGAELATTAEVPVGGGLVLTDAQIVITQPTEGEFVAFTAVCTHAGLTVTSVEDGTIHCANHGSAFSAETGEVENGPAAAPLAEVPIQVDGDKILAA